jgi:hypothetical protein
MQNSGAVQTRPSTEVELIGTNGGAAAYGGTAAHRPPERSESGASETTRWLHLVGPSTLIPALAFYFGWTCTNSMLSYFGVDPSVLGLTAQDYALRSADALFIPAGALLTVSLLAVWAHSMVLPRLCTHSDRNAWVTPVLVAVGAVLFCLGAVAAWHGLPVTIPGRQLFPGVGVGLVAYSMSLRRHRLDLENPRRVGPSGPGRHGHHLLSATLVVLLMVLSLFWAASDYATALGTGRAEVLAGQLVRQPGVVIYAKQRLHLGAAGVVETDLGDPASIYRYSYRGLRLVFGTAESYVLVPVRWSRPTGVAIVLPRTDSVHLEFITAGLT